MGRLLTEAGFPVVAVASRTPKRAQRGAEFAGPGVQPADFADLPGLARRILITVADDAIPQVAGTLAAAGMESGVVLHTCGALGPEALSPLERQGVACGALHPLQTIPSPERGVTALRSIAWGITVTGEAARWAEEIVAALDGRPLRVSAENRALYHAAGVTACNYVIGLMDAAAALMGSTGAGPAEALEALRPIVESSLRNSFELGPAAALTGPISRGDCDTVSRHLEALRGQPETIRELYRAAGLHTAALARRSGLNEAKARQLEQLLRDNRDNHA